MAELCCSPFGAAFCPHLRTCPLILEKEGEEGREREQGERHRCERSVSRPPRMCSDWGLNLQPGTDEELNGDLSAYKDSQLNHIGQGPFWASKGKM